jgi:dephospho-CoA kinase
MAHSTLKVGLTGGIACGKTTVTNQFAQLGVPIVDADIIAHALVEPGQPALDSIIQAFGAELIDNNGRLNRTKLRTLVFADEQHRRRLEAILHPLVKKTMLEQVADLNVPYCLLSIPLLIEKQWFDIVDRILVVDCPPALQRQRLQVRDGLNSDEIESIIKAQAGRAQRLDMADEVIYNDNDMEFLHKQVLALHQQYTGT